MDIELLVVPDCPHQAAAKDLLRTALADVGLVTDFELVTVTEDGAEPGFGGSPTFRVEGVDLFPTAGPSAGLSCRLYRRGSGGGLVSLPDLRDLRQGLKRAADQPHQAHGRSRAGRRSLLDRTR